MSAAAQQSHVVLCQWGSRMTKSFASIAEVLRKRYDLGYYPTAPARPGQTVKIKVKVEKPDVVVRARASYVYSTQKADK
jgi:hypothetical protein